MKTQTLRPRITVGEQEHRQLTLLATGGSTDVADDLLAEMERARVVPDTALPEDIVRMGSTARYRTNAGAEQEVTLVYPAHADISRGRISVMTPIGAALVGLKTGQAITWVTREGRKNVLTVLDVRPPVPEVEGEAAE
ncbi:nucleoside diphosphate kinase regulator [Devosia sp. A449]